MNPAELKRAIAALAADEMIHDNMKLGIGTGSTAIELVRRIRERREKGELLNIFPVPTSLQTEIECIRNNIPVFSLNDPAIGGRLDLTIDGADEVDDEWHLIKGGGGALLFEKVVAYFSESYAIMVDSSKLADKLGKKFSVPVEVIPQAIVPVSKKLEEMGAKTVLRTGVAIVGPAITKQGNVIIDCSFARPIEPMETEKAINAIAGVMENGIFTLRVNDLFVGYPDGRIVHNCR